MIDNIDNIELIGYLIVVALIGGLAIYANWIRVDHWTGKK